jgi:hypothetical protein
MNTLWMRLSLKARLLGAFTLVALIALPLIGWQTLATGRLVGEKALAEMAERESELTVLLLTESLVLRDYTSVEQVLRRQAGIEGVLALRYRHEQVLIEAIAPVGKVARPDWFANLLALKSPTQTREIKVGGVSYGEISLAGAIAHRPRSQHWPTPALVVAGRPAAGQPERPGGHPRSQPARLAQ